MIVGIGLDICDTARIARALEKPRFLTRIFTSAEQSAIAKKGVNTAAGYFAAKEAVSKALGTGFLGFMPWDIEIVCDDLGRPEARLFRGAQTRMESIGGERAWLSISHIPGTASAVCIIEKT